MRGNHNGTKEVLDHAKQKGFLDPFQAVNKIGDVEVSWTLGKMVLYASSQIPAADDALAVGFGSNKPGAEVPPDFQYAGGKYVPLPDDLTDNSSGDDWHDALFEDSPRRIPGLLIFLLILAVAAFLLCGRDRRTAVLSRLRRLASRAGGPGSSPRKRRVQFGKRAAASPTYERVLEEGGHALDGFELGDLDSEDETYDGGGSRKGRTSGWATPQLKEHAPGLGLGPGYFDGGGGNQASALGLVSPHVFGNAMERGGLMARTESRERLTALGNRSRTASPNRMRSPMMVVKEAAD